MNHHFWLDCAAHAQQSAFHWRVQASKQDNAPSFFAALKFSLVDMEHMSMCVDNWAASVRKVA